MRPIDLQFLRQWPVVPSGIGEAGEPDELVRRRGQLEAKLPTLVQVALHGRLHRGAGLHAALPGQGIATAASRPMSILA